MPRCLRRRGSAVVGKGILWASFEASNLAQFNTTEQFDAIVGRYILLYQPDPEALILRLLRFLKPGRIVVFPEMDFAQPPLE